MRFCNFKELGMVKFFNITINFSKSSWGFFWADTLSSFIFYVIETLSIFNPGKLNDWGSNICAVTAHFKWCNYNQRSQCAFCSSVIKNFQMYSVAFWLTWKLLSILLLLVLLGRIRRCFNIMVIMCPLMPIRQMINDNKYKLQFRVIGESPALKPSSKAPF